MSYFRFPPWTNQIKYALGAAAPAGLVYAVVVVNFGLSPNAVNVGYQPEQPVPYSHQLHSGQLGMDCTYCHNTVYQAKHSAIPTTETCMGCHSMIHTKSEKLAPIRESWESGSAVPWIR
ncbi:MAG: cytochrome c3 family protein, partial [Myxococcota bacterium]